MKKNNLFLIMGIISILSFSLFGCKTEKKASEGKMKHDDHEMHMQEMSEKSDVVIRKANENELGLEKTCPVMGTVFNVKQETDVGEYNGKKVFLCCPACISAVKNDPEKYIK